MITNNDKVQLNSNSIIESFKLIRQGLNSQSKINDCTDTQIKQLEAQIDSLRTAIFCVLGIQGAILILIYFMI